MSAWQDFKLINFLKFQFRTDGWFLDVNVRSSIPCLLLFNRWATGRGGAKPQKGGADCAANELEMAAQQVWTRLLCSFLFQYETRKPSLRSHFLIIEKEEDWLFWHLMTKPGVKKMKKKKNEAEKKHASEFISFFWGCFGGKPFFAIYSSGRILLNWNTTCIHFLATFFVHILDWLLFESFVALVSSRAANTHTPEWV